ERSLGAARVPAEMRRRLLDVARPVAVRPTLVDAEHPVQERDRIRALELVLQAQEIACYALAGDLLAIAIVVQEPGRHDRLDDRARQRRGEKRVVEQAIGLVARRARQVGAVRAAPRAVVLLLEAVGLRAVERLARSALPLYN